MSSIRPLATITVLAAVGVFLYLKINETEAPLPEGVEDWSVGTELDFDMSGGSDLTASPEFSAAPAGDTASSFAAAPTSTATSPNDAAPAFSASADTAPPAWNPPPADSAPSAAPTFNSAPTANSALTASAPANVATNESSPSLPDLPPLPALPPTPSTAPGVVNTAPQVDAQNQNLPGLPPIENSQVSSPATASVPPALDMTPRQGQATPESTAPSFGNTAPTMPPANNATQAQSSLFSATRLAVQAALDRGELSQALLLLSDWYDDPSLSPSEASEVSTLLGQLAGSVIYSTEHRLEPPYMVQAGERLETIAQKYEVPWQLLAKINGITSADQLQPGQQLKVIRGPFSALIDIGQRKMTLMLDRRYAGRFSLDVDPGVTVEEGHWEVNQKLLTPASVGLPGAGPTPTEERSLMLSNATGGAEQVAILRGATASNPLTEPAGRVLRMQPNDASDVFDILTLGSKVVIRR